MCSTEQQDLFSLCRQGDSTAVAELLDSRRGLFANCVDAHGNSPLHVCNDVTCAELLLSRGGGNQEILNRQNHHGNTPLASASTDRPQLANFLIDNGADMRLPNRQFQTPLHLAASAGQTEVVEKLLQLGQVDVNQIDRHGNAPLHYAVQQEDATAAGRMTQALLQQKLLKVDELNAAGRNAFVLAARVGNVDVCRQLRDAGCHLQRCDTNGANALHICAAACQPTTVEFLVADMQFSIDQADALGRTALFYAVHHDNVDGLEALLRLGADPNWSDSLGRNCLHVAAEKGHVTCLSALLEARADAAAADNSGYLPLHLAAQAGVKVAVKRLLGDRRANDAVVAKDAEGRTALDLARKAQHADVCELLESYSSGRRSRPKSGKVTVQEPHKQQQQQSQEQLQQQEQQLQHPAEKKSTAGKSFPRPWSAKKATAKQSQEQQQPTEPQGQKASTVQSMELVKDSINSSSRGPNIDGAVENGNTTSGGDDSAGEAAVATTEDVEAADNSNPQETPLSSDKPEGSNDASSHDSRPPSHRDEEPPADAEDDPYLTAKPSWITRDPPERRCLAKREKAQPNLVALRRSLHDYDRTVAMGRARHSAQREKIHLRMRSGFVREQSFDSATYSKRRVPRAPPEQPEADVQQLTQRYRSLCDETSSMLQKWKRSNQESNDSLNACRPHSARSSGKSRPESRASVRNGGGDSRPYRRPKSSSKFLEYFPNNLPAFAHSRTRRRRSGSRRRRD